MSNKSKLSLEEQAKFKEAVMQKIDPSFIVEYRFGANSVDVFLGFQKAVFPFINFSSYISESNFIDKRIDKCISFTNAMARKICKL